MSGNYLIEWMTQCKKKSRCKSWYLLKKCFNLERKFWISNFDQGIYHYRRFTFPLPSLSWRWVKWTAVGPIRKGHHLTHLVNWDARSREITLNHYSCHTHSNPNFFFEIKYIYMLSFSFILGLKFYFLLFQTSYHRLAYPITSVDELGMCEVC